MDSSECEEKYLNFNSSQAEEGVWCKAAWDGILCWPPTPANQNASLNCPSAPIKGVDPTQIVHKYCDLNGKWEGKDEETSKLLQGWTNYTPCFTPEMKKLMTELYAGSGTEAEIKINIAYGTRILEIVGLSISLVSIVASLTLFFSYSCLKNNRTKIHRNLFVAIGIQTLIRLVVYIDQAIVRGGISGQDQVIKNSSILYGIDNTPILCESFYVMLEYAKTAMFMWMFVEGLYLHSKIIATFQHNVHYWIYYLIGWGVPIPMTATWAVFTSRFFDDSNCWWGYNFSGYFWILEGPRLAVIITNLIFLLNIIKVLVTKLRETHSSEALQVRKAVKAAIFLLPLLGITNMTNMVVGPLNKSALIFGIWSYSTHFLTSFQGSFIALIYCFLNGEVQNVLKKQFSDYLLNRSFATRRESNAPPALFRNELQNDNHRRSVRRQPLIKNFFREKSKIKIYDEIRLNSQLLTPKVPMTNSFSRNGISSMVDNSDESRDRLEIERSEIVTMELQELNNDKEKSENSQ